MTRQENFTKLVKDTGLDFGGSEETYDGCRYIVIFYDGEIGCFSTSNTLEQVGQNIGDLIGAPYAFGGWYDLDDEIPHAHSCSWQVVVSHSKVVETTEVETANGECLI